jgi:ABC-type antimicrobial peptide transport system permease subunit
VINEAMARRFWPDGDPLGQRIDVGPGPRAATLTIVGIAGDVRPVLQDAGAPQIYVSYLQQPEPSISLMVRGLPGSTPPVDAVKRAIWSVAPRQAMFDLRPLAELVAGPLRHQRTIATLLGAFAGLALVMSLSGIYTVVSYLTSRRTKEIALRRAIGARPYDVLVLIAGQTFRWAAAGIVAGIGAAIAASRSLGAIINGVVALDATTVVLVCAAYFVVVALAMSMPALRALRLDPAAALRAE